MRNIIHAVDALALRICWRCPASDRAFDVKRHRQQAGSYSNTFPIALTQRRQFSFVKAR
jgi:hypothetical protein